MGHISIDTLNHCALSSGCTWHADSFRETEGTEAIDEPKQLLSGLASACVDMQE